MITHADEVAEGTYCLEARLPGIHGIFAIYFIKDDVSVLIEPGPAALVPTIQVAVKDLELSKLEYIIPTHIHLDHAGGLGKLAQVFPQAKVVVNPEGARHAIDPSRLIQSTKIAFGEDFGTLYGTILPVAEKQVKIVQDGEKLPIGSRELIIVHTPGHAPHHISIFDTKTKGLFCGEALGLIYTAGSPPLPAATAPSFDAEAYLASIQRLSAFKPRLLFYSHGDIGKEPESLISSVADNTKIVGDFILNTLKTQKTEGAIIRNTGDYIWSRFGARLHDWDLASNVKGYIHYFRKKGLK